MKWIIREGLKGISRAGSGASMARGLKKSRGLRMATIVLTFGRQLRAPTERRAASPVSSRDWSSRRGRSLGRGPPVQATI